MDGIQMSENAVQKMSRDLLLNIHYVPRGPFPCRRSLINSLHGLSFTIHEIGPVRVQSM